jgi:LCP family protein required for cell wall assembly
MRVFTARPRSIGRKPGWRIGFVAIVAVLAVVTLVSMGIVLLAPGGGSAAASFIRAQPGSLSWDGHARLNVLLMGADGTAAGGASDAMLVGSYDPKAGTLGLLGIPGGLWVTVPGFGLEPASHAYADGGARLALLTVQSVLHTVIPYYAVIGPDTGRRLVDSLGGLTVSVSHALSARQTGGPSIAAGTVRMNSSTVLDYAGARATDDGADRIQRQLDVFLAAIKASYSPANLFRIPTILGDLGGTIDTNVPFSALPGLVAKLGGLSSSHIHYAGLDLANGSLMRYSSGAGSVLVADPQATPALAHRLLGVVQTKAPGGLTVVNGSQVPGEAAAIDTWLGLEGVNANRVATSGPNGYARTMVVVTQRARAADLEVARDAASLLQVPLVTGSVGRNTPAVRVLIGRDFQDPTQQ